MTRFKCLHGQSKRYRSPGGIMYAWLHLTRALSLFRQIDPQARWTPGGKILSHPVFWPTRALGLIVGFAPLYPASCALSPRLTG